MKTKLGTRAAVAAVCIASLCASAAIDQQSDLGVTRLAQLLRDLRPSCERLTQQIASQPQMALTFIAKPIDTTSVCTCAEMKFSADPRLQPFWPRSEKDMKEPLQSEQVKSYITARMVTSILECLTPQLEDALSSAELPQ